MNLCQELEMNETTDLYIFAEPLKPEPSYRGRVLLPEAAVQLCVAPQWSSKGL